MNVIGRWLDPLIKEKKYDTVLYMVDYSVMILKTIYKDDEISIGTKMLAHLEIVKAVLYEILSDHSKMKEHVTVHSPELRIYCAVTGHKSRFRQ
jgi:hypothetical protein